MLDDMGKAYVLLDVKCGRPDDEIRSDYHISGNTLKAFKGEYEKIKKRLGEMKAISEIADELKLTEDYVETIKHIIETDSETLLKENAEANAESQAHEREEPELGYQAKEKKIPKNLKKLDDHLKKTADSETAAVLVGDAGDVAKAVAIERQEIGKFVMETMGTIAMQFGYRSFIDWLQLLLDFWIQNQGRITEMRAQIEELMTANQLLLEELERDMIGILINKSVERVTIAALIGGVSFDPEQFLTGYKRVLATDPVFLKRVYDSIHGDTSNSREVEAYAT